ncbi:MAG TPA: LLM class flavin-dependent oxidoreductase [Vicinamibacterales bacterium]|nr:LLM class flavin-dependent oxidoreductase [Vicinamibacterales bacterium]
MSPPVPLSVLDLVPVRAGATATDSLREAVGLARTAEALGYTRYWFAEHHGMASIASSAPEILIEHIASQTQTIRVGSGGIMLPNHAPLHVAETFHTLEALHPGRIDLGLGRAPGTDPATSRALRPFDGEQFPEQLREMLALSRRTFPPGHPFESVRVVPTDVTLPPIWVLGSSGAMAGFAGSLGLGYSFARHFSPNPPLPAIRAYREHFIPSAQFPSSHVILGVSVICAPTMEDAEYQASSTDLGWVRLHRREFTPLPSPEEAINYTYSPQERVIVDMNRQRHFIGTPEKVANTIRHLIDDTGADEIMVTSMIYGRAERLRSYELLAGEWGINQKA